MLREVPATRLATVERGGLYRCLRVVTGPQEGTVLLFPQWEEDEEPTEKRPDYRSDAWENRKRLPTVIKDCCRISRARNYRTLRPRTRARSPVFGESPYRFNLR